MIRWQADCALRIHHALPRNGLPRGKRMECVTHQTCLPRQFGKAGDLPIGSYATAWYS